MSQNYAVGKYRRRALLKRALRLRARGRHHSGLRRGYLRTYRLRILFLANLVGARRRIALSHRISRQAILLVHRQRGIRVIGPLSVMLLMFAIMQSHSYDTLMILAVIRGRVFQGGRLSQELLNRRVIDHRTSHFRHVSNVFFNGHLGSLMITRLFEGFFTVRLFFDGNIGTVRRVLKDLAQVVASHVPRCRVRILTRLNNRVHRRLANSLNVLRHLTLNGIKAPRKLVGLIQ